MPKTTAQKSELLAAMANPNRMQILEILQQSDMPVGALALKVGLSQSALSQHLARLRQLGLVKTRRDGQTIYYSSSSERVRAILETLRIMFQPGGGHAAQAHLH